METPSSLFDERLQVVARILQSVGISAVIWGTDALAHHAISSAKTRNDIILPNEDFLRAAEALRLHNFTALEPSPGTHQYLDGLDHYAAQYTYPPEITDRFGFDITIALFPASLVGWKLIYKPVPDPRQRGSFTSILTIEKIPIPVDTDVELSFIQLSLSNTDINDTSSVVSEDSVSTLKAETDDEYVLIEPHTLQQVTVGRRGSVAMERGNGHKSPSESVSDIVAIQPEVKPAAVQMKREREAEAVEMKVEVPPGAVEMLPGPKRLEKSDGQLILIEKGIYIPRREGLNESFKNAIEFLKRDNAGGSKFARVLEGWGYLLSGDDRN